MPKQKDYYTTQNAQLPSELIHEEILPRLPVKSLVAFKCVSKQWDSIISSPHFAKTQLNHQAQMGPPSSRCVLTLEDDAKFSILDYGACDDDIIDFDNLFKFQPFEFEECNPFLIGSCNGLVCFGMCDDDGFCDYNYCIYNPCVDEYVDVENEDCEPGNLIYGFGYVSDVDDYKIVVIKLRKRSSGTLVYVYSLRSNEWTVNPGFEQNEMDFASGHEDGGGVLVNETLHWDMIASREYCVGGFDLVEEKFKVMPLPRGVKLGDSWGVHSGFRLCNMDECLCAWGRYLNGDVEMWMMKECGVVESWTKLFRLNLYKGKWEFCDDFFGFTRSGKVLIRSSENLRLADLSGDRPKYVCLAEIGEVVNYVPSLISPLDIVEESEIELED